MQSHQSPIGPYWVIAFYRRHNRPEIMILLGAAVAVLVFANVVSARQQAATPPWAIVVGIALPALAAIGLWFKAFADWRDQRYNRRIEASLESVADPRWWPSVDATRAVERVGWRTLPSDLIRRWLPHHWQALHQAFDSLPGPRFSTLVDSHIFEVCSRIERPSAALPPVTVRSRLSKNGCSALRWPIVFAVIVATLITTCQQVIGTPGPAGRNRVAIVMSIAAGALLSGLAAAWPILRNHVPWRIRTDFPRAEIGRVCDARGRVWRVEDSLMLVEPYENRLVATFSGPAGRLKLRYYEENDDGFRALWQRWTHPNARPKEWLTE